MPDLSSYLKIYNTALVVTEQEGWTLSIRAPMTLADERGTLDMNDSNCMTHVFGGTASRDVCRRQDRVRLQVARSGWLFYHPRNE